MPWTVAFGRVFVPETLLITAYFHRRRLTLARKFLGALLFAFTLAAGAQSTSYEGETQNLLPHGQGTFSWDSGNRYTGTWANGQKHGHVPHGYAQNIQSQWNRICGLSRQCDRSSDGIERGSATRLA